MTCHLELLSGWERMASAVRSLWEVTWAEESFVPKDTGTYKVPALSHKTWAIFEGSSQPECTVESTEALWGCHSPASPSAQSRSLHSPLTGAVTGHF